MTQYAEYAITLNHDKGRITIRTVADSMESAVRIVLNAELAPRSAIAGVKIIREIV